MQQRSSSCGLPSTPTFPAAHRRWLALANSYDLKHRLSRAVATVEGRTKAGAVARTIEEQGLAFDPDDVTITIAYRAVLHQLDLVDYQDGVTLLIGKLIINLATLGERDAERLAAATVEALKAMPAAA
jgi:hypothetical protein